MDYEAILRAEGLAPLDCEDRGRAIVSSRGTINPRDQAARARMDEREAEREQRRTIAATRPTRHAWQRRALRLYAEGKGVKKIAATVRRPRRRVEKLLAPREAREAREATLIANCDTGVLMRLLGVIG